jgi:hypothetical protein
LPGTQPSSCACFHDAPSLRTPTITFIPLSLAFKPCPCLHQQYFVPPYPCDPYPISASVSFLKYSFVNFVDEDGYLKLFSRPITSLMDFFFCTRKVQCLHSSDLHHWNNRLTSELYRIGSAFAVVRG